MLLKCELEPPCGTYCQNITDPKNLSSVIWCWTTWPPKTLPVSTILWFHS